MPAPGAQSGHGATAQRRRPAVRGALHDRPATVVAGTQEIPRLLALRPVLFACPAEDFHRACLLQLDVGADRVVVPARVAEQRERVAVVLPFDRLDGRDLLHAPPGASGRARLDLVRALHRGQQPWLAFRRVGLEVVRVRQGKRLEGRAGGAALALPGRGADGVDVTRLQGEGVGAVHRCDVVGVHEEVGLVHRIEVGGPDVHRPGRQPAAHRHGDVLRGARFEDRAVVLAVRRLQRGVTAVRAVSAEVAARGVDEPPSRLAELGDMRGGPGVLADRVGT